MKYYRGNVCETVKDVRKTGLMEGKKDKLNGKQYPYFYDFSILNGVEIPENILESIKNEMIEKTNYSNDFCITSFLDVTTGRKYYLRADFAPIRIYSDSKNKPLYYLMDCIGYEFSKYKTDCYGNVPNCAEPEDDETKGIIRRDINFYIQEITV